MLCPSSPFTISFVDGPTAAVFRPLLCLALWMVFLALAELGVAVRVFRLDPRLAAPASESRLTAMDALEPLVGRAGGGMDLARSRSLMFQTLAFARRVSWQALTSSHGKVWGQGRRGGGIAYQALRGLKRESSSEETEGPHFHDTFLPRFLSLARDTVDLRERDRFYAETRCLSGFIQAHSEECIPAGRGDGQLCS